MKLETFKKVPEGITAVLVDAVLMPNGELITKGKTIGWFDDLSKHVYKNK